MQNDIVPDRFTRRVTKAIFSVMSPQEIIDNSVAHIHLPITKNDDIVNTLFDPRLGATNTKLNSITFLSQKVDSGNFGHLVLAKPCFHPEFFSKVKTFLDLICLKCANLRLAEPEKIALKSEMKVIPRENRF